MKTTFPAIFLTALSLSMTSLNAYSQEHDIEYFKNHVYLKTEINGKPANLLFDTVANKTPFTIENGGLGGKSTGYIISIANADIAGVITDSDMANYNTDKKGSMASTNYIANLGNEVWSRFDIILDLADNKIYLKKN